jgi:hypothetical protein
MSEKPNAIDYKVQLASLRERCGESIKRISTLRQAHHALHKALLAAIETGPKTVPELAVATGKPAQEIFWHLMALKKYNQVVEDRKQGGYVGYRKKS